VNRRVLAIATFCFALVIGLLVIVNSRRPRVEPATTPAAPPAAPPATPRETPRETPPPARADTPPRSARRAPEPDVSARPESPPGADTAIARELGTLRIETDVPGAQVFIDRQFIGTAPLTAENVKPGTHQVNVSAEGFDGIAQTIDVEPGPRDLSFRLREVRLDAALAVVHKHRIGSCEGRLVATVDGIRYETADKGDAFTAALGDLETFQVDYLSKNLRIKLRKGKQFDFTDPDGNADRLFVFHRDVDKARQRLVQ
jgi:hypothetical protein